MFAKFGLAKKRATALSTDPLKQRVRLPFLPVGLNLPNRVSDDDERRLENFAGQLQPSSSSSSSHT